MVGSPVIGLAVDPKPVSLGGNLHEPVEGRQVILVANLAPPPTGCFGSIQLDWDALDPFKVLKEVGEV